MTGSNTISIVIPTHNRWSLLQRTLHDVDAMTVPDGMRCEVIVVANACSDGTAEAVAAHASAARLPTTCISVPTPGLNPARNVGLETATGDYLLYLDDDIRVEGPLLKAMMTVYAERCADLVGGRVSLLWEAVERPSWLPDDLLWVLSNAELGDEVQESPDGRGLIGACFGFHRRVADTIGGFRNGLDRAGNRLLGGGESEFVQRAIQRGFTAVHVPAMQIQHWVAPHRVTREYIRGVCEGFGEARIYLKREFHPLVAARALIGHAWLFGYHGLASRMTSDPTSSVRHHARSAMGLGGVRGCLRRGLSIAPIA